MTEDQDEEQGSSTSVPTLSLRPVAVSAGLGGDDDGGMTEACGGKEQMGAIAGRL